MAVTQSAGIMAFENAEFGTVRVSTQDGEPWFVAKDVCDRAWVFVGRGNEQNPVR